MSEQTYLITPESFLEAHSHPEARKEMAAFFTARGRVARGAPRAETRSSYSRQPGTWLRGRGAVIWQTDGPHLVVMGTRDRDSGFDRYVEKMVTVPVEPNSSTEDRAAETRFLTTRLSVLSVGPDDERSRTTHEQEIARTLARLAELKS